MLEYVILFIEFFKNRFICCRRRTCHSAVFKGDDRKVYMVYGGRTDEYDRDFRIYPRPDGSEYGNLCGLSYGRYCRGADGNDRADYAFHHYDHSRIQDPR